MTIWYIEAVHGHPATNEYLAQVIGQGNEEYAHKDKICADGVKRNLFQCPRGYQEDVQKAIAAIPQFKLKIEVFKAKDRDDLPGRYEIWKQSVKKRAQTHRKSAFMFRQR